MNPIKAWVRRIVLEVLHERDQLTAAQISERIHAELKKQQRSGGILAGRSLD